MSLRDVDRSLQVMMWFYQHRQLFDMIDEKAKEYLETQTHEDMDADEFLPYEVSKNHQVSSVCEQI